LARTSQRVMPAAYTWRRDTTPACPAASLSTCRRRARRLRAVDGVPRGRGTSLPCEAGPHLSTAGARACGSPRRDVIRIVTHRARFV
jgi:hypothetical protein